MTKIVDRLVFQLKQKGMSEAQARSVAIGHLQKSGVLKPGSTELTPKGMVRNSMSAASRAKDRAAKASGAHKPGEYLYNQMNNVAHLKEPHHAVKVTKVRKTPTHK